MDENYTQKKSLYFQCLKFKELKKKGYKLLNKANLSLRQMNCGQYNEGE